MAVTARANLLVRKPLVYRDSRSYGHVIGRSAALQDALDEIPDGVDVQVERIRDFPSGTEDWTSLLSDRQHEALEMALRMGYYEQPREATHADIASALECAPNTVTTHLQKAEAKLVQTALDDTRTGTQ
ncbi:helix-turn-helix domain-containing protein [Halovivax cerinus]|uniref:Helix-turn-helix domain-containing protein n=2 Tax=Halovivax cerinus TaxID=1487865 RepID=A0ABD5NQF3_9EURY|nr:helix-turn-helix domain-containing protein [Halovivax cerinus]